MQLITFISAATAMVATASANAVALNSDCNLEAPHASVINRCDYTVYLWSVHKGAGCPTGEMVTLKTGETYNENLQDPDGSTGISIKISKQPQCKPTDIVQLEYFLDRTPKYEGNYLDVSYVDCLADDCPTKSEGFYLVSGNQTGSSKASADNTRCPVISCNDAVSCAKSSYILPDDVQTKFCDLSSNLAFYMCGGEAPSGDYDSSAPSSSSSSSSAPHSSAPAPAPVSSTKKVVSSSPAPTPVASSSADGYNVKAAAVTPTPQADEHSKTKTHVEVVYVTAYEYVNAKRHTHGHARRHQPFHA